MISVMSVHSNSASVIFRGLTLVLAILFFVGHAAAQIEDDPQVFLLRIERQAGREIEAAARGIGPGVVEVDVAPGSQSCQGDEDEAHHQSIGQIPIVARRLPERGR